MDNLTIGNITINKIERAKELGIDADEIRSIISLIPEGYFDWQDNRENMQDSFPITDDWLRQCTAFPGKKDIFLRLMDERLEMFGIEVVYDSDRAGDIWAEYLNSGDYYGITLVYDFTSGEYSLDSVADWEHESLTECKQCGAWSHKEEMTNGRCWECETAIEWN